MSRALRLARPDQHYSARPIFTVHVARRHTGHGWIDLDSRNLPGPYDFVYLRVLRDDAVYPDFRLAASKSENRSTCRRWCESRARYLPEKLTHISGVHRADFVLVEEVTKLAGFAVLVEFLEPPLRIGDDHGIQFRGCANEIQLHGLRCQRGIDVHLKASSRESESMRDYEHGPRRDRAEIEHPRVRGPRG